MGSSNVQSTHDQFQAMKPSGVNNAAYNFYGLSNKRYQGLQTMQALGVNTNAFPSDYQIWAPAATKLVEFSEAIDSEDQLTDIGLTLSIVEHLESEDQLIATEVFTMTEDLESGDELTAVNLTLNAEEHLESDDSTVAFDLTLSFEETIDTVDLVIPTQAVQFEEHLESDDSTVGISVVLSLEEDIESDDSTFTATQTASFEEHLESKDETHIILVYQNDYSVGAGIIQYHRDDYSANVGIMQDTMVAATDQMNVDNPWQPTMVDWSGGTVSGTNPGDGGAGGPYTSPLIQINESAMTGGDCAVYDWSIDLNFGGGQFMVHTKNKISSIGTTMLIGGLKGTIEYQPKVNEQDGMGYKNIGYFGVPAMQQEILLALQAPPGQNLAGLATTQYLQVPPSIQWSTISTAAQAIASIAGISLKWFAPDEPLLDLFIQSGMRVGNAINSLASRVGAVVIWDGNTNYTVTTPTQGLGVAPPIPICQYIKPGGIQWGPHQNVIGPSLILPVHGTTSISTSFMPSALVPPLTQKVEQKWATRNAIKSGEPPTLIDLPADFNDLRARCFVTDSSYVGLSPIVTTDPDKWTTIGAPILFDSVTNKRQASIDSSIFPAIPDGKFSLSVGYTRNLTGLQNSTEQNFSESLQRQQMVQQVENETIRYFLQNSGQISCPFFGAIPMPGSMFSQTIQGVSIQGIVISTSISGSGNSAPQMTFQLGQWVEINLLSAATSLNAQSIGNPPP